MPHPRVLAFARRGRLFEPEGQCSFTVGEWLDDNLRPGDRVVVKPVAGGGGRGILFVVRTDKGFEANGVSATREELSDLIGGVEEHIVTAYIEQAEYAARLYAPIPNTVRILTLWDVETGVPFVATATHRIGTSSCHLVE